MDIDKVIMQRDEMLKLLIQMNELLLKWDSKGIAPLHITIEIFDEKVRQLRNEVEAQVQSGMDKS